MLGRFTYGGVVGLLLTLGCEPRVEIGHGSEEGGDGQVAGSSAGTSVGGKANFGGAGSLGSGGTLVLGSAGAADGGADVGGGVVGGTTQVSIPADDGPQARVDKVDLLLAVDNSLMMLEKQKLLSSALPGLVKRLINPRCVSPQGAVVSEPASPDVACPVGSEREIQAVRDLHVGVITSSLGSHGAAGANDVCVSSGDNDKAHLLATVRPGVPSYEGVGYLKWDPDGAASPPGESDAQAFADALGEMLAVTGESGCGYEAPLESVYRFLVDPEPPLTVEVGPDTKAVPVGVDAKLLAQRASFLRPDSSVVVVLLSDENDCSIRDDGYGWLLARGAPMFRGTSTCATDPNDPCCQLCAESTRNPGCSAFAEDPACQQGLNLGLAEDNLNLRCYRNKERFGYDFLYPIARYVNGFGDGQVPNRKGQLVDNPLFHADGVDRDRSLFTLAVIGGVPWQDIATPASLTGDTLTYMTPAQLATSDRWSVIAGQASQLVEPLDPFMREAVSERSGKNPIIGESLVGGDSTDPRANSINGHERLESGRALQYSCIFELPEPIVCDEAAIASDVGCECSADESATNNPVCQPPGGGTAGTTQYFGGAYPPLRALEVAEQLGRRSVLGSICSRNTQDAERSDYGYRPVVEAIGRRVTATVVQP